MRKRRFKWGILIIAVGVILICLWVLSPFYSLIMVSLSPGKGFTGFSLPPQVTFDAYKNVLLSRYSLWRFLINSVVIAGFTTILVVVLGVPCGYGLSRLHRSTTKHVIQNSFFILQLVPPIVLVIPLYLMFIKLNLYDTRYGIIMALAALNLPFGTLVLKGFCDTIPRGLEEAAWIDGATIAQTVIKVISPLLAQGAIAVGMITFLMAYIDYLLVLVLSDINAATLSIYVAQFRTHERVYIPDLAAAAVIGVIPMAVLYALMQKYIKNVSMAGFH